MSVPTLICPCGQRLKAPGLKPGRTGRCPQCGSVLTVSNASESQGQGRDEDEGPGVGYGLDPSTFTSTDRRAEGAPKREPQGPSATPTSKKKSSKTKISASAAPRNWWPPDFRYPARGSAEALGVIATLSVVFWIFTILIPEYCASIQRDAESMGAQSMGHLVSIVTSLPAVILTPLAFFYTLQYFARVLVARAMGDSIPPRSPDRNFDGFLSGLGPWFVWLFLSGAIVPLLLMISQVASGGEVQSSTTLAIGLAMLPYWLMALMLSFLHDDQWAAKPWTVISTILKLSISYGALCITVAAVVALSVAPFAAVLSLRDKHFWVYVPASLIAWAIVLWGTIVALGTVGGYYHKHREQLRWHQERPRWGVTWKL